MTDPVFLTVVVPGSEPLLPSAAALASVVHQSARDFELLIAFEPGTQDRDGIVARVRDRARIEPRFAEAPEAGLAQALNAGVASARGRFVTFLVGDDRYAPDRVAVFERAESVLPRFVWGFSGVEGEVARKGSAADPDARRAIELSRTPLEAVRALPHFDATVSLGNLMVRADVWREVGGLRDLQYLAGWDLALRLLELSPPYIAERALYQHRPLVPDRSRGERARRNRERMTISREHRRRMAAMRTFAGPGSGIGASRDELDPDDEFAIKTTLWAMEKFRAAPRCYGLTRRVVRAARAVRARGGGSP